MDTLNLKEIQAKAYSEDYGMLRQDVSTCIIKKDKDTATELLADTLKFKTKFYTTQFDERNEMYYYEDGIYRPEGRTIIKQFCRTILEEVYTEQLANRVASKIEAETYIEQDKFLKRHYQNEICVLNGILNLKTRELTEFSQDKIFFHKINAKFDEALDCPKIDEFLYSILPEENDVKTVYEFAGYCLLGGYPIQKIALFIGDGGNGKGQLLNLIKAFLGDANFSGIPLQKLEQNDFKESELQNKLANIGADISDAPLKTTAKIKGLSGGDSINASRKFKQDVTFENEAKLIFSANKLPKTYDTTRAFFRRWVYLVFPYKFMSQSEIDCLPEDKRDGVKLKKDDVIKSFLNEEEYSGFLNKCLEGLNRLLFSGDFTSSKTGEDTMRWWVNHSDSLLGFCYDHLIEDSEAVLTKDDFRRAYQKYCRENKVPAEGDKHVKETLTRTFHAWDYQESDGDRVWGGISLREITGIT